MRCHFFRASFKRASIAVSTGLLLLAAACGVSSNPGTTQFPPIGDSNNSASGPILAYWWDTTAGGIRPVLGVAGAAHQGQPIYSDGSYTGASVCAHGSLAILTAKSGALFLTSLPNGKPVQLTPDSLAKMQIVFSPSCASALEYAPNVSGALLFQGLSTSQATPQVMPQSTSIRLPAGGMIVGLAVADSGTLFAAAARTDGSISVQSVSLAGNSATSVTTLTQFGGMAFLPGADNALLADAGKNTVLLASQSGGAMSLTQVAGIADGISQPFAIAASADGHAAVVANRSHGSLIRIDLSGQSAAAKVLCQCSPTVLEPLRGNAVFRLNEPGSGTVWAFDGDTVGPRIVFIPADRPVSAAGVTR